MISRIRKNIYAKTAFLCVILIIFLFFIFAKDDNKNKLTDVKEEINYSVNAFEDISLEAKAAFVWDVNKKEAIYNLNEEAQLPLASLAKLMTVITAMNILPESSIITIDKEAISEEGDSGLFENEKWNLLDIVKFTLISSSNDGASAVANVAGLLKSDFPSREADSKKTFTRAMNEKAKEIGLNQTYFINPTGLDTNEFLGGGYGSARDMSLLMEYAIVNNMEIFEATKYKELEFASLNDINHTAINTNSAVNSLPGLIASKTGFTDLAEGNLIIAFDAGINRPIIITVLGSTQNGRFRDVEKLLDIILKNL
ncbi:hypothetical protein COT82_01665 [Candidatus Campbellbacteria bacterium CG10_big_fil_rev_8_21_14_0_10_35_52]|uniref:Peptidase S11 D-alanyl-D-alanine carboxypeptidase A N-terminal domain-containing protein n=1 Tax=Candidatus Campbellbacteria bacterium CG10_big_fil_rev_8_21_14_0_10_35_52 TaxID=1974527 RepID=A0A2M6WVA0_9BACT|nr:MAG: hypothetical protein COT82_01665 [Candidatus Campbellbacteria bacterium CG10_big_fil_rev_8_21_14_0_10_35_52]